MGKTKNLIFYSLITIIIIITIIITHKTHIYQHTKKNSSSKFFLSKLWKRKGQCLYSLRLLVNFLPPMHQSKYNSIVGIRGLGWYFFNPCMINFKIMSQVAPILVYCDTYFFN